MKKMEFLYALNRRLLELPKSEREERVNFYREMIEDRIEEGIPEEEAVAGVGTIDGIVAQILADRPSAAKEPPKQSGCGGKVWVILLLVLGFQVWFPILLSVFITVTSVVLSLFITLWSVDLSFAAAGVGGFFCSIVLLVTGRFAPALFAFGGAVASLGLAVLTFFGSVFVSRAVWRATVGMVRGLIRWLERKEKNNG